MAPLIALGVAPARVSLVADAAYFETVLSLAGRSAWRLLCSVFIVDITPVPNHEHYIDTILEKMAEAGWRGADTRLLIGGSRDNVALAEVAEAARARALARGISCRWLTSHAVRGSHMKVVIADDAVLTGSHNWSPGAVTGDNQTQDSVLVESRDIASLLAARFEEQWHRAEVPHAAV